MIEIALILIAIALEIQKFQLSLSIFLVEKLKVSRWGYLIARTTAPNVKPFPQNVNTLHIAAGSII